MTKGEKQRLILAIEDEKDFVMGLQDAFAFEGYLLQAAATGAAGITLAADLHPNLIILDLMLPDINGYQVCEQIRRRVTSLGQAAGGRRRD